MFRISALQKASAVQKNLVSSFPWGLAGTCELKEGTHRGAL